MSDGTSQTDYEHDDHGEIVEDRINTRKHDDVLVFRCTRCNTLAEPHLADDIFDDHDCDRYKELGESITGRMP